MYKELDDSEILYMIKESDDYYEIMLDKYKPLVLGICKKYRKRGKEIGYELEDLMQVANLGLIDAIKSYKDNQNALFYTYLTSCVENKIKTEFRNNHTNKKIVLNEALSYDVTIPGTEVSILDILPDENSVDPLSYLLTEQKEIEYINFLNSLPFEVAVIYELRVNGFSFDEISKFLEVSKSVISRSLSLVKTRKRAYV